MHAGTKIRGETAKRLTPGQELALLRAAFASNPSQLLRVRVASLLNQADAFDETIALLGAESDLAFGETMLLVHALLARETNEANVRACAVAQRAVALAADDRQRGAALADLAKAQVRVEDPAARETLVEALRFDPHNKNACKRLASFYLRRGDPHAVIAMLDGLSAQGVGHSRLFAAQSLALARIGEIDSARAVVGIEQFQRNERLAPPPGWNSIAEFNAALARELSEHPDLRFDRYGTASEQTWRLDAITSRSSPLVSALFAQIGEIVGRYIEQVARIDHPWARSRPAVCTLHGWCVMTDGSGYETWHVHQFGWLSGSYYVSVPDSIAHGTEMGGCIAFGLPDDLAGPEAIRAFGERLVRPQAGVAILFPSHVHHRTYPHRTRERRICVAFDLQPE